MVRQRVAVVGCLLLVGHDAWAICRIVEGGGLPPIVVPAQSVLFIRHHDPGDSQDCQDGGAADSPDADGKGIGDAGDDGGPDGGCFPARDLVTMVVQPKFALQDGGTRFALLMVTPAVPTVGAAPSSLFIDLAYQTAPLVQKQKKYVEDPSLGYQCSDPKWNGEGCMAPYSDSNPSANPGSSGWNPPSSPPSSTDAGVPSQPQIVGSYEVAVLAGADLPAVASWLTNHSYRYDQNDLDALMPYVADGYTVIAVQVHGDQAVSDGALEPLSFTWEGTQLRLPVGVSRQPWGGTIPLTVYVRADGRYDFRGAHVSYAQWAGTDFLTRNEVQADLGASAFADPIARAVAGNPTTQDTTTVTETIRIPSSQCPSSSADSSPSGCGCRLAGDEHSMSGPALLFAVLLLGTRRRARR